VNPSAPESGIAPIHDFTRKLLQPSARPVLLDYLEWRRAVRAAVAAGEPAPELPQSGPLSINLDLTTACNYACDHCIDWDALNVAVRHEEEELRDSIRNLKQRGLQSVILIGGGEPTLYPGFEDFVWFLKDLGLQVAVVTNGSRNDRIAAVADCLSAGDWVRLSLDSGSDEVFQAMHHPKGKGISLDEICRSAGEIKQVNPEVQLGFSFVITWNGSEREQGASVVENLGEMEMATARAMDAGFDYISFKPFLARAEDGAEVMDPSQAEREHVRLVADIRAGLKASTAIARDGFRVVESINLRVFLDGSWEQYTRQPQVCHMQAMRQVLSPLGVFNCPAHRGVGKARIGEKGSWAGGADDDAGGEGGSAAPAAAEGTAEILDRFDASTECKEVTCLYHSVNHFLEGIVSAAGPIDDLLPRIDQDSDCFL
jgi:pyruvate-formate lyase-activating enzyme